MFLISCPWCGPRDQREFKPGGEAHIVRPLQPAEL
ncbi:MAG TPA: sarcosine oxidase subunit delta, partial [Alphaproteobacteria bacterium]|nr:sarcosine oxidase subunit delta [Alphaproteobacteria bacterium]